jgi:hypothetical protein
LKSVGSGHFGSVLPSVQPVFEQNRNRTVGTFLIDQRVNGKAVDTLKIAAEGLRTAFE